MPLTDMFIVGLEQFGDKLERLKASSAEVREFLEPAGTGVAK